MKLIIENWRRFLNEQSGGSIDNTIDQMFQDKHVLYGKPWGKILRPRAHNISSTVSDAASASGIGADVLLALIAVESVFKPKAKSDKSTARGYTQILKAARLEIYDRKKGIIYRGPNRTKPAQTNLKWKQEHFKALSDQQAEQIRDFQEDSDTNILAGALYLSYLIKLHKRKNEKNDKTSEFPVDSTVGSLPRALCEYNGQGRENTDCTYYKKIWNVLDYSKIEKGVK